MLKPDIMNMQEPQSIEVYNMNMPIINIIYNILHGARIILVSVSTCDLFLIYYTCYSCICIHVWVISNILRVLFLYLYPRVNRNISDVTQEITESLAKTHIEDTEKKTPKYGNRLKNIKETQLFENKL